MSDYIYEKTLIRIRGKSILQEGMAELSLEVEEQMKAVS